MWEKCWTNIHAIKANMLLFELVAGLKVTFNKSMLVGINVNIYWLDEAGNVLNCS